MDLVQALRILDHPQATDVVQKMLSSCPRQTAAARDQSNGCAVSSSSMSYDSSEARMCPRCSVMVDVLCATGQISPCSDHHYQQPTQAQSWTLLTLQQIVSRGGTLLGRTLLSDLSSAAIHNLLTLLELNVKVLSVEALRMFVDNIEALPFLREDEWCKFLIHRVRNRINVSHSTQSPTRLTTHSTLVTHSPHTTHSPTQNTLVTQAAQSTLTSSTTHHTHTLTTITESSYMVPDIEMVVPDIEIMADVEMVADDENLDSLDEMEDDSSPRTISPGLSAKPLKVSNSSNDSAKLMTMKICQDWLASKSADQEVFNRFCSLSNIEFQKALDLMKEKVLPEAAVTAIHSNISSLPLEMSYHNAINLLHTAILPIVVDLKRSASRDVVSALSSFSSTYPEPMVKGLMIPLLQQESFGAVHGNLLLKLFNDSCTQDQWDSVWRGLVEIREDSNSGIYSWNDEIISVALALLEKEVTMGEDTVKKLIEMLRRNALSLCKSSKFAKLIIKLCKTPQYHMMVMPHHKELSDVAGVHESIMKSTVVREIKKLSNI